MSRGAHTFKQGDLAKALKAAARAGVKVQRVEITEGKIILFPGDPVPSAKTGNEWDDVR
jgi:hypothetical protein